MNSNNNRALEFLDAALQALQGKRPDHQRATLFVTLAIKEGPGVAGTGQDGAEARCGAEVNLWWTTDKNSIAQHKGGCNE